MTSSTPDHQLRTDALVLMTRATREMIQAVERPQVSGSYGIGLVSDQPNGRSRPKIQQAVFNSRDDALDFLQSLSVWVYPSPDAAEQMEIAQIFQNVAHSMLDHLGPKMDELEPLNTLVRGLFRIRWLGEL